jgi:hypothetical protein
MVFFSLSRQILGYSHTRTHPDHSAPGSNKIYHAEKDEHAKDDARVTKIQRAIREHTYPRRTWFYYVPTITKKNPNNK